MRFFVPDTDSNEQAKRVYDAIREHVGKGLGATFSDRRVFALAYVHEGKHYSAEVGTQENRIGEMVVAILYEPARALYHVCTQNRGVLRGMSILVGSNEVESSTDFDKSDG